MQNMVREHVMQQGIIKRSGIIAASFLIATLATVIANGPTAHALLDIELPLGKNLSPITNRVNGLVNKSLGLPVTVKSTDKVKVNLLDTAKVEIKAPVVSGLVDTVDQPLGGVVNGLSDTLEPVTDRTIPAVRGALSRTLGGNSTTTPANEQPEPVPAPDIVDSDTEPAIAGVSTTAPSPTSDDDPSPTASPTFLEGVTSFFASSLPTALKDIARGVAGKEVGILPIIISVLLFLLTLGAVGGIVHASNHGGAISIGRYKYTLLTKEKDLTETATFIVVAVGFGVVAILLALTIL